MAVTKFNYILFSSLQFGFGKKKKKAPEECLGYCPYCVEKNVNINASQSTVETYEEKQREESSRKEPNFIEPRREIRRREYVDPNGVCRCTRCRRQRGEDPLTVELLPMDTQVTLQNSLLQNSLQDAGFMCCIL